MPPAPVRQRNWGEGGGILILCAVLYYLTAQFDSAPTALSQNIPPEFFPQLMLTLIALLACFLFIQPARLSHGGAVQISVKMLATAALLAAVCVVFQYVSAAAGMVLCCIVLPLLWGERRPTGIAIYAVLYPVAVYGLFGGVLNVRFPENLWN